MKQSLVVSVALCFALLLPQTDFAQTASEARLRVSGEVKTPLSLTLIDLMAMPSQEVTAKDKEGGSHVYRGVTMFALLQAAGVTLGKELRGKNLTKSLLLTAADGYQVVYALAEIDPEFTDQEVLVAYEVDGKALPAGEGPLRIVAPAQKKPARWIRELASIQVLAAKE